MIKKIIKSGGGGVAASVSMRSSAKIIKLKCITPADLSDEEFYAKCRQYGVNARGWFRRFAGLLPEVAKRGLYRKKGFLSLHEFANKLGGMSNYAVDRVLNLSNRLQDKPALLKLLESGEEGWSKIETVASVVTPETDGEWVEKVGTLSFRALGTCVKDARKKQEMAKTSPPGADDSQNNSQISQQPEILQPLHRFSFPISQKVDFDLRLLKNRLEKKKKYTLTWDQVFDAITKGEEMECAKCAKQKTTVRLCLDCARKRALSASGRALPSAVRRFVKAKYGEKCAFPGCAKQAIVMHHSKRFSLNKSHVLDSIVPLCKEHHDLAHAGMIAGEDGPPEQWRLRDKPKKGTVKARVDEKVRGYKKNL